MTMRYAVAFAITVVCGVNLARSEPIELEKQLRERLSRHKGTAAIALKNLQTAEAIFLNADEVMPTASLIKLAVMVEVYYQIQEKKFKENELLTLTAEDKVPGSGILTDFFSPGVQLPIRDCVRLMIAFSDNTATNMILDKIGIVSTNKRMGLLKLSNTRIYAKVFRGKTTSIDRERTRRYGLGSTTAREMLLLVEMLHRGTIISPAACQEMLADLKKCQDQDKFSRYLPRSLVVAHKTGSVEKSRNDAGLIYLPGGPIALSVLTSNNEDTRWLPDNAGNLLCADVAQIAVNYYQNRAKK